MNGRKSVITHALMLVLAIAMSSSCTLAKISGAGPRPLLLNNPQGRQFDVIKHFVVEKSVRFDYTNSAEMDRLVAAVLQQTQADAVANIRVTLKATVGDFCVNAITCGIANSRTWSIEGDAIKFK